MIIDLLISLILIAHGFYTLYAGYRNKPLTWFILKSDFFLEQKILGSNFNKVFNLFFGSIEIVFGVFLISNL